MWEQTCDMLCRPYLIMHACYIAQVVQVGCIVERSIGVCPELTNGDVIVVRLPMQNVRTHQCHISMEDVLGMLFVRLRAFLFLLQGQLS